MGIWKLEACKRADRVVCRWGYAVADTAAEALIIAQNSRLPQTWVHARLRAEMLWPGRPDENARLLVVLNDRLVWTGGCEIGLEFSWPNAAAEWHM